MDIGGYRWAKVGIGGHRWWWGGVVAHEILVSAQGPLVLGFWVWGLGVRGLGLTKIFDILIHFFHNYLKYTLAKYYVERLTQIIGDTIEQDFKYLEAQRGFVLESGVPESRKKSQSQASGLGYGLI